MPLQSTALAAAVDSGCICRQWQHLMAAPVAHEHAVNALYRTQRLQQRRQNHVHSAEAQAWLGWGSASPTPAASTACRRAA